ncbi:MarR family winged helix-turn-helix transcriptional regulator [Glaciihabitans sp. dw_435]|uniref:MarR family winged helix-turn-helix transcriptional regulator n=1 Tax=Glaciihabitans sp. dw_435 TaxID=2720081 RepID=UPI001BD386EE|nr:MarR family transcriptional regulator [Glaciihabitans sp. dw_435]
MANDRDHAALAGDELQTWSAFATVLEWLPAALDAQLIRDSEVTHFEYGILYALATAPNHTLRLSVLAGYANSSLSRLSRATTRLEARGWLHREPDPSDGRYTLAVLSDSGRKWVDLASPGHVETVRQLVLNSLTPTQVKQLGAISARITQAIRTEGAWHPDAAREVRPDSPARSSRRARK